MSSADRAEEEHTRLAPVTVCPLTFWALPLVSRLEQRYRVEGVMSRRGPLTKRLRSVSGLRESELLHRSVGAACDDKRAGSGICAEADKGGSSMQWKESLLSVCSV